MQVIYIDKDRHTENITKNKQFRILNLIKQSVTLLLSASLIPIGIYLFITTDKNVGIFILGAGFSSIGLSGFINSDFVSNILNKFKGK